jgi:uncharacterized protein (TIGR04255 family)
MSEEIQYDLPPIAEVVCQFQFVPSIPWDAAIPGLIYPQLRKDYPKRKGLRSIESQLNPAQGGFQQQFQMADRVQFLREDEKAFVQIGTDFLAINHLDPYPGWGKFRPIIRQGFEVYREIAKPSGLLRIGLRYINLIKLPGDKVHLNEFFKFYPDFGHAVPNVAEFMMGAVSPFENERDALRLQMNTAIADKPDDWAIILDLDYFLVQHQSVPIENALDWIDAAHNCILTTFENCLTDALRAKFSPRNR